MRWWSPYIPARDADERGRLLVVRRLGSRSFAVELMKVLQRKLGGAGARVRTDP